MDSADDPCPKPVRAVSTPRRTTDTGRDTGTIPRHLNHLGDHINATVIRRALYILIAFPLGTAIGYTAILYPAIAIALTALAAIITGNYLITRRIERRRDRTPEGHTDVDLSLLHTP